MTALEPRSTALLIAMVIPRSLNEPVGFRPSSFRKIFSRPAQIVCESDRAGSSGVLPSNRVITGVSGVTGRKERYSSMRPRHMDLLLDADPVTDLTHDRELRNHPQRLPDVAFCCLMRHPDHLGRLAGPALLHDRFNRDI